MRERVLAIVSLIAQYVMEDQDILTENDLIEELLAVGYAADEIDAAFLWMENLSLQTRKNTKASLVVPANRIFSQEECRDLSLEARGFLLRLRNLGIIDDELEDEIIDRAVRTNDDEVDLKEIKNVAALVLFARSHDDWLREIECFIDGDWKRLYH